MGNIFNNILESDQFREEHFVAETQARLANLMDEKGVTRAELARKLEVSRARITQIFSDDANNLTLRLLARSFLVLGETPIILTKAEFEKLRSRVERATEVAQENQMSNNPNGEVLTASLIAELFRNASKANPGDHEKLHRGNENVRSWMENGSNVIPLRRVANG